MTMKKPTPWLLVTSSLCILVLWLASCGALEDIGERPAPTNTGAAPRNATIGGRVSVWLVSPTNQSGDATLDLSDRGQVVGPVASATALSATLNAATQTAAAPPNLPNFQPNECPFPSGRIPEGRPESFAEFPAAIGAYLSEGGQPTVLESEMSIWGALTLQGGIIQANTDLTGDKIPEIIITLFNPFIYNPDAILNSGQLLVYGCDNGGYRLLYQTPNSPGLSLPVLHRVGDMNGDVKAELVFDIQRCSQTACDREGYILSWNPITGVFEPLNNAPILAQNGRLGVVDIDSDGILELTAASNPTSDIASGPRRSVVDIWDWTGKNYILAVRQQDDARYRIHTLHDADAALRQRVYETAIAGYRSVRDDENLQPWTLPNERQILRAFANYRLVIVYARRSDGRAESTLSTLLGENPEGTPGSVYAAMANAFMTTYRTGAGVTAACQSAINIAATRPDSLSNLNSYGYANPSYTLTDLCPF